MEKYIIEIFKYLKDAKQSSKLRKEKVFTRLIEPAIKDFELVHSNYLSSLKSYYEMIEKLDKIDNSAYEILNQIKTDAMFSDHLRQRLYSFYDYTTETKINSLSNRIYEYLIEALRTDGLLRYLDPKWGLHGNFPRSYLYEELTRIVDAGNISSVKREECLRTIEYMLKILADHYRKVFDQYFSLKIDLLN